MIALEGIDGSGKTTVLRAVAERLRARGEVVAIPRPDEHPRSEPARRMRDLGRDPANAKLVPRAELALYCAREAQIWGELVEPAKARGETVLLDRCLLTPLVLGAFGRGLPMQTCRAMVDAGADASPDLVVVLDVHPSTSRIRKKIERIRTHALRRRSRKSMAGSALKARMRDGYLELARARGFSVLQTERAGAEELADRVLALVDGAAPDPDPPLERPVWLGPPDRPLEAALADVPEPVALWATRGLAIGRALRAGSAARDPALCAFALSGAPEEDRLREQLAAVEPDYALAGLRGRPPGPDDLRLRPTTAAAAGVRALRGVAGPVADQRRRELVDIVPGAVVESLAGRDDAAAEDLRARAWAGADAWERTASLIGCSGADAWRRRDELLAQAPWIGLESLAGTLGPRTDACLARHAATAPRAVLAALVGRNDAAAHALRRALAGVGAEVLDSLVGLVDEESWRLRADLADPFPDRALDSLAEVDAVRLAAHAEPLGRLVGRCTAASPGNLLVRCAIRRLEERSGLLAEGFG